MFALEDWFLPCYRAWRLVRVQLDGKWLGTELDGWWIWINNVDDHTTQVKLIGKWTLCTKHDFMCAGGELSFQQFGPCRLWIDMHFPVNICLWSRQLDVDSFLISRRLENVHIFGTFYCRSKLLLLLVMRFMRYSCGSWRGSWYSGSLVMLVCWYTVELSLRLPFQILITNCNTLP